MNMDRLVCMGLMANALLCASAALARDSLFVLGASTVSELDASTGAVLRKFPVPNDAIDLVGSSSGAFLYVVHFGNPPAAGQLSVIDLDREVVEMIRTPANPVRLAFDRGGRFGYLISVNPDGISRFDAAERLLLPIGTLLGHGRDLLVGESVAHIVQPTGLLAFDLYAQMVIAAVGGGANNASMFVDQAQQVAYVADIGPTTDGVVLPGALHIFSLNPLFRSSTIPVGLTPTDVVYSSWSGEVFVANRDSNSISVIDPVLKAVVGSYEINMPGGLAISRDGRSLYASSSSDATVHFIDLESDTVREVPCDPQPSIVSILSKRTGVSCPGDCDGNGEVQVHEIVALSSIASGTGDLSSCRDGDRDDNGHISIDELISSVTSAYRGCALSF